MNSKLNVCIVGSFRECVDALEGLGHNVLNVTRNGNFFCDLPDILEKNNFKPDLLLQIESLGERTIVQGLDELDCPTAFWAMDPHLNLHWHSAYARLFDQTFSTQKAMVPVLKNAGVPDVRWLPMYAYELDSPAISIRKNDIGFVGRINNQRRGRKQMVEFIDSRIGDYSFPVEQNLGFNEMLTFYQDTKIIPNESILGEVNFRLFEGASCGALVLTQDLGEEQASLFEPGREIDTYADVLELEEKLKLYLGNDRLVQVMGQAAHARVQAEHLAVHRIEKILDYVKDGSRNRASGADAGRWLAITLAAMWESGMHNLPVHDVLSRLAAFKQVESLVVSMLRVQAASGMYQMLEDNIMALLGSEFLVDSFDLNLTGSTAALRLDNWDAAKAFWYRQQKSMGAAAMLPPKTPKDLLILWTKDLKRRNRIFRGGFPFNPGLHLPYSAVDCLMVAYDSCPGDPEVAKLIDVMIRPFKELDQIRGDYLLGYAGTEPQDWRVLFELGITDLHSYRLDQGMKNIALSEIIAREQGQERAFAMTLKARDDSGMISRRLGAIID
ncbi:glycosyltransferase [Maridesulfovibrio sp.]|uniref:CgeB family protein n=1 Tax=Maridesulfovibrio sp. TaxID=2795000 RepID=UPI0029F548CE|nr:glycosyltransferase [Maridesulfovibrio sp.]